MSLFKSKTIQTFKGQFWWIVGMRWEGWEWIVCNIGGGEEIKGIRKEVPPPFAILQASRGAKRRRISWQEELRGGWRSDGVLGKFLVYLFIFKQEICSQSLGSSGVVGLAWTGLWLTSWTREDDLNESESFVIFDLCSCFWVFVSVLDTGWCRKYSPINV